MSDLDERLIPKLLLWHPAPGRLVSESGKLCPGDGSPRTGRPPPEGARVCYVLTARAEKHRDLVGPVGQLRCDPPHREAVAKLLHLAAAHIARRL